MTAPELSPVERMEQVLFDLLHLLSAAEDDALALVEHSLDPEAAPAQFFAASSVQYDIRHARGTLQHAMERLADVNTGGIVLVPVGELAPQVQPVVRRKHNDHEQA